MPALLRQYPDAVQPPGNAENYRDPGFNLPVDMIATSHGVVWRDNPTQIVELYLKWAADYQEDRITIVYDTMSNNTRMMADAIAQGLRKPTHAWR